MTDSHRWLVRLIQSESVQLIHSKEPHQSAYVRELGIYPMQAHNSSKTKNLRSCWILTILKIFKREPFWSTEAQHITVQLFHTFTASPRAFALLPYFTLFYCITLIDSKDETSPVLRAELPRNSSGSRWLVINPC